MTTASVMNQRTSAAIIPTPLLFQVAGIATLLEAIPLWFVKEHRLKDPGSA